MTAEAPDAFVRHRALALLPSASPELLTADVEEVLQAFKTGVEQDVAIRILVGIGVRSVSHHQ